jgi:hypothetical protein
LLFVGVDCWNPELVLFPQNLRTSLHLLKLADVEPHPILFIFSTKLKVFTPQQMMILADAITHCLYLMLR